MQSATTSPVVARNRGQLRGQKPPLKPQEIWSIRVRLQLGKRVRDLALFNLAIDSKLRGCDLVALKVRDVAPSGTVASRAIVMQRKTKRPVQFEITDHTRDALAAWIWLAHLRLDQHLFPSRIALKKKETRELLTFRHATRYLFECTIASIATVIASIKMSS